MYTLQGRYELRPYYSVKLAHASLTEYYICVNNAFFSNGLARWK